MPPKCRRHLCSVQRDKAWLRSHWNPVSLSGRDSLASRKCRLSRPGMKARYLVVHRRDAPHVFYSFIVEDIVLVGRAIFETSLVDVRSVGSFAIPSFKLTACPGRAKVPQQYSTIPTRKRSRGDRISFPRQNACFQKVDGVHFLLYDHGFFHGPFYGTHIDGTLLMCS